MMASFYKLFVYLALFRFFLDLSYHDFVEPMFNYMGFNINFDLVRYCFSWVIYLVSFAVLKSNVEKVSDYFLITCIVFLIAPMTSLYGLDLSLSVEAVALSIAAVFIIRILVIRSVKVFPHVIEVKEGYKLSIVVAVALVVVVIVNLMRSGVALNFNPEAVYQFRDENAELADVGFFAYLNNWVYQIVSMYLLIVALRKRNYALIAGVLVMQFFFFAASAHKAVLFLPIMVLGVWFVFSRTSKSYYIVLLYLSGIIFLYTYYLFTEDVLLPSLFIRRAFFVPSQLNFYYVDFFNHNGFVYWSQSILKHFIEYPYHTDISSLIGEWAFGDDTRANNGLVSSGFANFGWFGVFIYSVILGLIVRLIDDLSFHRFPVWVPISMTAVPLNVAMIQTDLLTSLLTHGLLVSVFFIALSRTPLNNSRAP
ncbi:hypothetical protein [Cellvibrio sp.]|uniref:hypothetical protein n=1 Tax=Cellvibrio sp. TaxID=1965322 RepID=UPI0039648457